MSGAKAPFGRTPKVANRIAVPPLYSGFNVLLCVIMVLGVVYAIVSGNYARALFPLFNGVFYAYGLVAFIGLRQSWADALLTVRQRSRGTRDLAVLVPQLPVGRGDIDRRRVARPGGSGRVSDTDWPLQHQGAANSDESCCDRRDALLTHSL